MTILFICTGNWYRSRLAEAMFNHRVAHAFGDRASRPRAISRGLAVHLIDVPIRGPISPVAREALAALGIDERHTGAAPVALTPADVEAASLAIALDEREHAPMVASQLGALAARVSYWQVPDVAEWPPARAIAAIEANVRALVASL